MATEPAAAGGLHMAAGRQHKKSSSDRADHRHACRCIHLPTVRVETVSLVPFGSGDAVTATPPRRATAKAANGGFLSQKVRAAAIVVNAWLAEALERELLSRRCSRTSTERACLLLELHSI